MVIIEAHAIIGSDIFAHTGGIPTGCAFTLAGRNDSFPGDGWFEMKWLHRNMPRVMSRPADSSWTNRTKERGCLMGLVHLSHSEPCKRGSLEFWKYLQEGELWRQNSGLVLKNPNPTTLGWVGHLATSTRQAD